MIAEAIRLLCFTLPAAALLLLLGWRKPDARLAGAALLATLWNLSTLLLLNVAAMQMGWWQFEPGNGAFHGIPWELYFGWALLWGAIPVLAFVRWPVSAAVLAMLIFDLIAMPLFQGVVHLGPAWLIGETVGLVFVLWPALYLARWSYRRERLVARVCLLVLAYSLFLVVWIPSIVSQAAGKAWRPGLPGSSLAKGIFLQMLFLCSVPALSAVQEFCQRGSGTPLPFDPPRRLVTSGPYAYLSNPMQMGTIFLCAALALCLANAWFALATVIVVTCIVAIASWQENDQLGSKYGNAWAAYRLQVRAWWPRWTPHFAVPCTIYIAESCGICSGVADWLKIRRTHGLLIQPGGAFGGVLWRMTYEAPGWSETGIRAFARCLEHIHLGWAIVGWALRLPIIAHLAQWLVDVSGGGPRRSRSKRSV